MSGFRHGDATIHYEEFGRRFQILTLAPAGPKSTIMPEWKTGAALDGARTRVQEFLTKHTP